MSGDPILDGITRWTAFESLGGLFQGMNKRPTGKYVLFSDLPALLAAAREEAAEAAMQIGRQIEKDNHAAGLCEPSYTHGREYQQQRLTNHDMHSGLSCLTNYEQGQRDEREACIDTVWLVRDEKGYSNPEWQERIVAAIRARSDGGES